MFWASPKIWLLLVPLQKLLCRHKNQFYRIQIIFLSVSKCLWVPPCVNKFLVWHKKCRPAQNILGPVKGHGIRAYCPNIYTVYLTHFRLRSISGTCSLMASDWLWKVLLIFTFFVALWPEYPNFVQKIMSYFFLLKSVKIRLQHPDYNTIIFFLNIISTNQICNQQMIFYLHIEL